MEIENRMSTSYRTMVLRLADKICEINIIKFVQNIVKSISSSLVFENASHGSQINVQLR
jgi:hypothetical protein